ncbi:MAG: acyltransferase [Methylophilaceae bacterium]
MITFNHILVSRLISFSKGLGILLVFSHHFARSVWSSQNLPEPLLQQWQFSTEAHKFSPLVNTLFEGKIFESLMLFFAYFGYVGVHLFVISSGIGLALGYRENETWKKFMLRRLTKIVPAFWAAVVLYSVLWWLVGNGQTLGVILRKMFMVSMFYESEFFAIDAPLWFLGLIFQLYVIFPFLYRLAAKYDFYPLLILVAISYSARYLLSLPAIESRHTYLGHANFMTWLPIFYLAILVGYHLRDNKQITCKLQSMLVVGLGSLILSIVALNVQMIYPLVSTALAVFAACVSICLYWLSGRLAKYMIIVGNVSYAIYLYHRPVVDKLLILMDKKNLNDQTNLFIVYIALFVSMVIIFKLISSINHPVLKVIFPRG